MSKKVIAVSFKTSDFGPVIFRTKDSVYHFYEYYGIMPDMGDEHHHLYYLSTDKIKKGDWGIQFNDLGTKPVEIFYWDSNTSPAPESICHKIVASSDRKLNKEFGISFISEINIKHYCYKNGEVEDIVLKTEEVYVEPPEHIHSNRGDFVDKLKLDSEDNVILENICVQTGSPCGMPCGAKDGCQPLGMSDWNKLTMDQYADHLEDYYMISSSGEAKCAIELVNNFRETKKGLQWILDKYVENVNEEDEITEKLNKLLGK